MRRLIIVLVSVLVLICLCGCYSTDYGYSDYSSKGSTSTGNTSSSKSKDKNTYNTTVYSSKYDSYPLTKENRLIVSINSFDYSKVRPLELELKQGFKEQGIDVYILSKTLKNLMVVFSQLLETDLGMKLIVVIQQRTRVSNL